MAGPLIDKISLTGTPNVVKFPRALNKKDNYDFSFSGLKTSIRNYLQSQNENFITEHLADITASVQAAIVDSLVKKTIGFASKENIKTIIVAGGVSANSALRNKIRSEAAKIRAKVYFPALEYCMDNAAMIGAAAIDKFERGEFAELSLNAFSKKGIRFI